MARLNDPECGETSCIEMQILIHYYCYGFDYKDDSEAAREAIERFLSLGLLKRNPKVDSDLKYVSNDEALKLYINRLKDVPLPVQKWIIPERDLSKLEVEG